MSMNYVRATSLTGTELADIIFCYITHVCRQPRAGFSHSKREGEDYILSLKRTPYGARARALRARRGCKSSRLYRLLTSPAVLLMHSAARTNGISRRGNAEFRGERRARFAKLADIVPSSRATVYTRRVPKVQSRVLRNK